MGSMLSLRPYNDEIDFPEIYKLNCDPEAMRYIRTPETEEASVRARVNITLEYSEKNAGFGIFMIINDETGAIVGNMILRHANWDNTGAVEIGYVINPKSWGNGYATQAIKLLIEYAKTRHNCTFMVAFTDANNGASNRVLEKNGFVCVGEEYIYEWNCLRWERAE